MLTGGVMLMPEISLVVARAFSLSCNITPELKSCAPRGKRNPPAGTCGREDESLALFNEPW